MTGMRNNNGNKEFEDYFKFGFVKSTFRGEGIKNGGVELGFCAREEIKFIDEGK